MAKDFGIPQSNIENLLARLETLAKKAKKLKLSPVETQITGFTPAYRTHLRTFEKITHMTVTGGYPNLPGYEFVGTIQHMTAGNILRLVPGNEVDSSYQKAEPFCDHCKTLRARNDTYLVRHESGKLLQVGKSCIKDFLGGVTPQQLLSSLEFLREMGELSEFSGGGRGDHGIFTEDVFLMAAVAIREFGWQGKDREASTSSLVRVQFSTDPETQKHLRESGKKLSPIEEDREVAAAALSWARSQVGSSESYLHNVGVAASEDLVFASDRSWNLLVSGVQAYNKKFGVIARLEERRNSHSEWVGEVKARSDFELICLDQAKFDTVFGTSHLYKFQDEAGNQLAWFASREFEPFKTGEKIKVKATVKAHNDYKGTKQTMLTRVKA